MCMSPQTDLSYLVIGFLQYCAKQTPAQIQKRARRNYLRRARSLYSQASPSYSAYHHQSSPQRSGVPRRRFTREERRSKRVKRLVRQLSRSFREYYCEWHRDTYTLQPECSCVC
uniref:ORF3 n=1 Tax=Mesocestoides corti TaxID=53468 RepID=A0A5K3FWB7_MESCO